MKKLQVLFSLVFVIILSGCATLFKGSNQDIGISSDPISAKVYVNGSYMGQTPLNLNLKVNKSYNIEFRMDGYQSKTVILNNTVGAGWIVLDVLGGIVPVIIDAATGSWNSLDQDHVNAALEKQIEAMH